MKRSAQSAPLPQPARPQRMQTAGLYGEVIALPVSRAVPAPPAEPKSFI